MNTGFTLFQPITTMAGLMKFEIRKPVTPYICSTPLDFDEERQFLSNEVFPKISDLCKLRGSYFSPVDLRWKPAHSMSDEGLLLKTLLSASRMCRPFFLCLLGETYGPYRGENESRLVLPKNERYLQIPVECDWLERNLILAGSGGHPWVLQEGYQYRSITELEVTQGALLCDSTYVTLYFRRSDHVDNKRLAMSENGKFQESDLNVYCSESQQAKLRIHDLRQRLVNKGVPVKYFSTLEELGQIVLNDWKQIVDMHLPPLLHDVKLLDSIVYREWLSQQSLMNSCSEVFVSTPDVEEILRQLTDFAMPCTKTEVKGEGQGIFETVDWSTEDHTPWTAAKLKRDLAHSNRIKSILLLSGGRGVGKSTLVTHWLNEFREDNSHACVISHFVSASNRSMELIYFMRQTIKSLRKHFLISEEYDSRGLCAQIENEYDDNDGDFMSLCDAFVAAISLGQCVILLDGLNELSSNKNCDWLPEGLPKTCKMIFTTTSSDISYRCLSQRPDTTIVNFPMSMSDANTTVVLINQHFPTLSQLIGGEKTLKRLAHLKIMQTALGSRVTGSELACYRVYSKLDTFMEQSAEVWSLRDFWTLCVQNWVREHSWTLPRQFFELHFTDDGFDYSGWVTDCLCLIAASRNGLTQDQVISVLKLIGYEGEHEISNYDWLQFRLAAGPTLRELGDGRLVFGHKYLQDIAEYLFFKSITSCSNDAEAIIGSVNLSRRRLYHKYLARYFSQLRLNVQVMEELPWHLLFSGEITNLVKYLTNCQKSGHLPDIVYLQLMHDLAVVDINDVQAFEDKYNETEMMSSAERIAVSTPQPSELSCSEVVEHKSVVGLKTTFRPMEEGSREHEQIKISEDLIVQDSMEGVFVTQAISEFENQSHTSSAKQLKESSMEVASLGWYISRFLLQINQRDAGNILLSALINYIKKNCPQTTELYLLLCRCYHLEGGLHEDYAYVDEAEKSYRLALHSVMDAISMDDEMTYQNATQYLKGLLLSCHGNIYIYKKQLSGAEELLNEALDCVNDNSDAVVLKSTIYFYLGIIRSYQFDYQKAEFYLRESAKLRSLWFGRCHPLVAEVLVALAKILVTPNNNIGQNVLQARSLYKHALAIQEKYLGASHLSVAEVLFEIGKILAEENSHLAIREARECFRRCLDIRTTTLGGNHPATIATQHRLTKLDVALQLKSYESGSSKYTDNRSYRRPFSILTLREHELSKLLNQKKSKAKTTHSADRILNCLVSEEGVKNYLRPDSIMNTVTSLSSACERLLSAPIAERPHLLWKKRDTLQSSSVKEECFDTSKRDNIDDDGGSQMQNNGSDKMMSTDQPHFTSDGQDQPIIVDLRQNETVTTETEQKQPVNTKIQKKQPIIIKIQQNQATYANIPYKEENGNVPKEGYWQTGLDSYANVIQNSTGGKKTMILPSQVTQTMFQKFERGGTSDRPQTSTSKNKNSQRNVWSSQSRSTTMVSSTSSHHSHCNLPGRHDITLGNTQTITGPYSCLTSLLGDPPCPRQISNNLHHMSAWYHVPGRFPTPQEPFPKKRMQRTKSAKDIEALIAIKALSPQQHEKYKLTEQERSQIIRRLKKNVSAQKDAYSCHSSNKPGQGSGSCFRYPKLMDKRISLENLFVNGMELLETRHPGNV